MQRITIKKAKTNNLKEVDLQLEADQLIVFTGVSGSGKSSLVFDTLYVEGQRRYIESLSMHARRHLGDFPKPDVGEITGLGPVIAIEQKSGGRNPRSTVGTLTGIYDFLRVLFAKGARAHCPVSGEPVEPQSISHIVEDIYRRIPEGTRVLFLSPYKEELKEALKKGFIRARIDGKIVDLTENPDIRGGSVQVITDRLVIEPQARVVEAVTKALELGSGCMQIFRLDTQEEIFYARYGFSPKSGISYPPLEPQDFSFNHPAGMCPRCQGLGRVEDFDLDVCIDPQLSIAEDACKVASSYATVKYGNIYDNLARIYHFDVHTPWKDLSAEAQKVFLYGTENRWTQVRFVHKTTGKVWQDRVEWRGVLHEARMRYEQATSASYKKHFSSFLKPMVCPSCHGGRLKPYPAAATLEGKTLPMYTDLPIDELSALFATLSMPLVDEVIAEIRKRLDFLMKVGLHYMTLNRTAPTLSGGEMQRVHLASHICSGLVGTTYILDEPSIGLHPKDTKTLIETFRHLQSQGNRVIVVEHDGDVIASADHIVDVGPGAGKNGGKIIYEGPFKGLLASQDSLTGAYLSGRMHVGKKKSARAPSKEHITLKNASHHNLKNVDLKLPLGRLVAVTGVSGSGKSSLITETLYPALLNRVQGAHLTAGPYKLLKGYDTIQRVIAIDQSPIGRTPRSNPATYIKAFDAIRQLFADQPMSVERGYDASCFSFNVKEGSCPVCRGMGLVRIDMDFMEDSFAPCSQCLGRRFDEDILAITYRGKNIHDVLEMTIDEAIAFLPPKITQPLAFLASLGLGYLTLGQPAPTFSGGEAQRIKLAKELLKPPSGKTIYLLDEPTTGLHFHDVDKLLSILEALVAQGHTVVVIEHNMDFVRCADWVIELGPTGGAHGGYILAEGTPRQLAQKKTPTGKALSASNDVSGQFMQAHPPSHIVIQGARHNYLKNISLRIPIGKMSVFVGPSGSGKSSLAFDILYAEGQRRYIEALPLFARQYVTQPPKPHVDLVEGLSAALCIERKELVCNPRSTLGTMTEVYDYLRILFAHRGTPYSPITGKKLNNTTKESVLRALKELPGTFSILAPVQGDIPSGFVRVRVDGAYIDLNELSRSPGEVLVVVDRLTAQGEKRLYEAVSKALEISVGTLVVESQGKDMTFQVGFEDGYPPLTPHTFSFNTAEGMCPECTGLGCPICIDSRLSPFARSVRIDNYTLVDMCSMPLDSVYALITQLQVPSFLNETKEGLIHRIGLMCQLGLGYLSLGRAAPTLSSGEVQRVRLARQLGTGLTGCLYVLGEPARGLHPHDIKPLHKALDSLKALGNTLVLVEHDLATIRIADKLYELGPSGGKEGGYLISQGTPEEVQKNTGSLTGAYLNGTKKAPIPSTRRKFLKSMHIKNATKHNLKNLNVRFPLKAFSCITGVSGSGKTTLMSYLAEQEGARLMEPHRGGYSLRSDVATYMDLLLPLRLFFAELPGAQAKGLKPGNFSYNHKNGMCTRCSGRGYLEPSLYFLPPTKIPCDGCSGFRLTPLSLEVRYKEKHLGEILQLSVYELRSFFPPHRKVMRLLEALIDTGLGYLSLSQEIQTLSDGEASRLQLARELARPAEEPVLYLFDEPTLGLHADDVCRMIPLFHRIVEGGHTLVVIEHNLDVVAAADYIVDLGPGAGSAGGKLIAEGTPEEIAVHPTSITGRYLADHLL